MQLCDPDPASENNKVTRTETVLSQHGSLTECVIHSREL